MTRFTLAKDGPRSLLGKWLPVFLWAAVIYSLSSMTQVKASEFFVWDFVYKKIAHVTEYAILYALILRATKGNFKLSLVLSIIYSVSDELHQSFVPGRTAAWFDLGFDLSGAGLSAYTIWKLLQIQKNKLKK